MKKKPSTDLIPFSKPLPPVERTAEGLRDALFDELNLLRTGETTTAHARAIANVARLIVETARLEFQQVKALMAAEEKLGKGSIRLGSKEK